MLAGLLLITACASPNEPFSVVEDVSQVTQTNTVEAIIPESKPDDIVIYEAEYPDTYIVQKGDTLWDISSKFLRDPWHWPEIWFKNPQIENPHLIYPGDVLAIIYIDGQKRIQLARRGVDDKGRVVDSKVLSTTRISGLTVVKLVPRIRSQNIDANIPSIPIESIRHMLARPQVIDKEELSRAAYIISSFDDHLVNSINDKLYVRKLDTSSGTGRYQIFRPDKPIFDPGSNELLGYQALYVGESKLLLRGDPATVQVTNSVREILRNDRVLPIDNISFDRDFFPRPPVEYVHGEVVSLLDAISQVGQYRTLAINLGTRNGVKAGNLLDVKRIGDVIPDTNEEDPTFRVKLPDERIGIVMIIRAFEKMSYALVMEASRPISVRDSIESP